jgi:hypothetical protein
MKCKIIFLSASLLVLFGSSMSASGQWKDNMGGSWNNPTSASIGNIVNDSLWNRLFAKARARDKARAAGGNTSTGVKPTSAEPQAVKRTPAQIDAAVRFRSTGTQLETQNIANELGGDNAELRKEMATIIGTLLTEYEKAAKAQGKPNDIALATTAALVYNSSIYNGTAEPSDERIMEIRDALAELMAEDATLGSMTDRQKQVLYEKLVIATMLVKAGYEYAKEKGDKTAVASYREAAGQTIKMVSGLPAEKVDFSDEAARRNAERLLNVDPPVQTMAAQAPGSGSNADYLDSDPFPDKPHIQAQKPLMGRLRKTITAADLAGNWQSGGASIMEYVNSGTSTSQSVSFTRTDYTIRADGTYVSHSQSRASNMTIRETDSGSIILSGGLIIVRSAKQPEMRYQFVSYMIQPNGAVMLSLVYLGDKPEWNGDVLRGNCDHAQGYISCMGGAEWVRLP